MTESMSQLGKVVLILVLFVAFVCVFYYPLETYNALSNSELKTAVTMQMMGYALLFFIVFCLICVSHLPLAAEEEERKKPTTKTKVKQRHINQFETRQLTEEEKEEALKDGTYEAE